MNGLMRASENICENVSSRRRYTLPYKCVAYFCMREEDASEASSRVAPQEIYHSCPGIFAGQECFCFFTFSTARILNN